MNPKDDKTTRTRRQNQLSMNTTAATPNENPAHPPNGTTAAVARLTSLDAYRGFVMFLMMAEVLKFSHLRW